jgi:Lysyl oxidase
MLRRVLVLRVAPVASALTLAAAALAAAVPGGDSAALLPDLDQEVPSELVVTRQGAVHRLGFRSAVRNLGQGPLLISSRRVSADAATMTADQVVRHDGRPATVVRDVGRLRYTISPDHRHWHLLRFERYQLRPAGRSDAASVGDRKTGFCLGDRYPVRGRKVPGAPERPVITGRCGLDSPRLQTLEEGISVGYGDDYDANLEGQYLRLTGLPSGRYVLVHRVNGDRGMRELRYDNNAASLLVGLRWRDGAPRVRVLRTCPESDRCDRTLRLE